MNLVKYFMTALRNLGAKGHRNGLKIFTLGVGLAAVLVLSAKICFEQTTDTSYDGSERIYYVTEAAVIDGLYQTIPYTSGGIAGKMNEYFPQVECATRFANQFGINIVVVGETERISCNLMELADSSFFKVLTTDVIAGDVYGALGIKDNAAVSMSMARKIYRGSSTNDKVIAMDVIGKAIRRSWDVDEKITVTGVYQDFPSNSSFAPDIVVSMPTIVDFFGSDMSELLIGSDSFTSLVKLTEGTDPNSIVERMDAFREKCLPVDVMREFDFMIDYTIYPYLDYYKNVRSGSYSLVLVLFFVAVALLLTSVLNYLLNVISSTITRSREMALRKCIGCEKSGIYKMIFAESLVHTLLSVGIAVLIVNVFGSYVVTICGCSLAELFSGPSLVVVGAIVLFILLLNTIVPSEIFNRIPVASAFRSYRENKRRWKQVLLSIEFLSVAFLGVMAMIIAIQYSKMVNSDMGFRCDDVVSVDMTDVPNNKRQAVVEELRRTPGILSACAAHTNPFHSYGGNNVSLPGEKESLFNVKDGFYVESEMFDVLDIPIVEGNVFTPGLAPNSEVIVDELFAEKIKMHTGWNSVIGHQVTITSHNVDEGSTIVGVMRNFHTGSFSKDDELVVGCPVVYFNTTHYGWMTYAFARLERVDDDALLGLTEVLNDKFPDMGISITPFRTFARHNCVETLNMRDAIIVGCLISLVIAVLGLMGYTIDEIKLRQKEIAVRRVNGAHIREIRNMFIASVMKIALPSVLAGCICSAFTSLRWQEQFKIQVGSPWWVFVVAIVSVIAIVLVVNVFYVSRYANENPAVSLKSN